MENAALREAAFDNIEAAREAASQGLKMAPASPGASAEAALAMAGDQKHAELLVDDLNRSFPAHTQMRSLYLPPVRAALALQQRNTAEAVKDLQPASPPIEFALIPFSINVSCLYPTYIRGQAFLAAGNGAAAISESRRFSIAAELCGIAGPERWRIWASHGQMRLN